MRYIQSLVTRTRQTDKIPMSLMLDALNHTLASPYDVEFESLLPTYLCDCNYKDFKTSSFHKRFNPCHNCLMVDLRKTVSRTFRYSNKSDVRVKDPITETETVYLFFADDQPKLDINSTEKVLKGFIGEDLEGRALPKELISEFKKDEDWDDFYSDDSSWESYGFDDDFDIESGVEKGYGSDYESDYDYGHTNNSQTKEGHDKKEHDENEPEIESCSDSPIEEINPKTVSESEACDFQILQQIKSKKYILDVDQKIIITNVATIDLDRVPTKEECGDDFKWMLALQNFIRSGWCRINILRNSGDGDKEIMMIAKQLRLMTEAYQKLFALENQSEESSGNPIQNQLADYLEDTEELERELMPVLKKMVCLGKDKEAMLAAKNWLPILKELYPTDEADNLDEAQDSNAVGHEGSADEGLFERQSQKRHLLVADVMTVLGVLEFRRHQDGWAAQHLLESIKLAYQYALNCGETFDVFAYLSDPKIKPSSTPWLLTEKETLRLCELLSDRAPEYLTKKQQWFLNESLLSYLNHEKTDMDQKEMKKLTALRSSLTKKMLSQSESLIDEDEEYYVPKVAQLWYDRASYYYSKGKLDDMDEHIHQAKMLMDEYPDLVPLSLKTDILVLSIRLAKRNEDEPIEDIDELIEACRALYQSEQDIQSLEKIVNAYLERIELDKDYLNDIMSSDDDDDYDDYEEEEEDEVSEDDDDNEEYDGSEDVDGDYEEEDYEDDEFEDDEGPLIDIFSDDDIDREAQIKHLKKEIGKDLLSIQSLIDDYKKNSYGNDEEDAEQQPIQRKIQVLGMRVDLARAEYLSIDKTEEDKLKAALIYQDLIESLSQMLSQQHDEDLYQLYRKVIRQNAVLCFGLKKYNEIKKGYKQLISYQKNMIEGMEQKGRAFQEANLELAHTYCYLGAFYWDLETWDHALKYGQIAQSLVDKYADLYVRDDVETKLSVYSFLHLVAQDAQRPDIDAFATKEGSKIERLLDTRFK